MALAPRGVGDLGDHCLEGPAVRGEAVVEAHRVEGVAEGAEVGEEPDRPRGAEAERGLDAIAGRVGEVGGAGEVVRAAEGEEAERPAPQRPRRGEQPRQLVEVEVEEVHAIGEGVPARDVAGVGDPPRVDGALADHSPTSKRRADARARSPRRPRGSRCASRRRSTRRPVADELRVSRLGGDAGGREDGVLVGEPADDPLAAAPRRSGSGSRSTGARRVASGGGSSSR